MAKRNQHKLPPDLARARDRFTAWRRTKQPRSRIPESLWELAVQLAGTHGLYRTARTLKLNSDSLKKRVEAAKGHSEGNNSAFLELPSVFSPVRECVIELEDGALCLRIHLKGYQATEIATVGRSMRDAP